MKMIHEMRERQAWTQPKSTSPLPIVLGAVIAFGIGLLGMSGIVRTPGLLQTKPQTMPAPRDGRTAEVTIDATARRIGRAESAPLLKSCVPFAQLAHNDVNAVPSAELYRLLQSASSMSRVAAMAGIKQTAISDTHFATVWADVADCIFRQNGWVLCDPDNRALAVEAANAFVRQLSTAAKTDRTADSRDKTSSVPDPQQRAYALQNAGAIKGRVLAALRSQLAEGRLIAADFGYFVPAEIAQVVRETAPTRDGCAARN